MAINIPAAIFIALAGAGVAEGVNALTSSNTKSHSPTAPSNPSQSTANQSAAATVADQRENLIKSGGITDYTGGLGVLTGSDVNKSSLVGG